MNGKTGPLELRREVMDSGLCTGCGLCVGLCPYIKTAGERVAFIHRCGLAAGNCYRVCPRTPTDWAGLDRAVFGRARDDHVLGHHREILLARSGQEDAAARGQYGGVVSALAAFLLASGRVAGAVLTGGPPGEVPRPVVAASRQEVLACAGSRYSASPTLAALNRGLDGLAVVGRPCQVEAVRKMQGLEDSLSAQRVRFVIGLFCFWSLATGIYDFMRERAGGRRIGKVDIPREGLALTLAAGTVDIPLEEVRPLVRRACLSCFDPTAEFADVAVGSTEYDPRWNTLLVRSARGGEMVAAARAAGVLETRPYPSERLPLLIQAVRDKKLRVLEVPDEKDINYLKLSDSYRQALIREGGEGR